ncbi:PadR family transcriptional regulator [Xylophilus sp. Leaf220]|uniref:PadR family transcriptional regulator n=1 Tax=Xylophilus sp. Leaf220 TaxID=1735686 RepID=UPI0006F8DFF9|nr:PadR family transcriptional regulator [Xylophilus sp. Leaf220]KQM75557.1 PadR family transcriptional regulator [Xylophilus sp. Leaf220]
MKETNDDIGRLQGRGGGRVFGHGGLRLVILQLIADKPCHGYELIKAIEDRLAGRYSPSPGVVYPTLTLLEELGLIAAEAAGTGTRRSFCATPAGHAHLAAHRQDVDALFARMDTPGAGGHGLRPPPVVRAIENLKLALRMRLARTPLTDAQAHAIAAVLDDASQRLERIE